MSRDDFWDDTVMEPAPSTPRRHAARQALLVDVFLLLFAWLYAAKVSPRAGLAVLAVVMLLRRRRIAHALKRTFCVLFAGGTTDPQAIRTRWAIRSTVSGLLLFCSLFSSIYGVFILAQLGNPNRMADFARQRYMGLLTVAIVGASLIAARATWKCPACGRKPGLRLNSVRRCARCGASLEFEPLGASPARERRASDPHSECDSPASYNHGTGPILHVAGELAPAERAVVEALIGFALVDEQQLYIAVPDAPVEPIAAARRKAWSELEAVIAEGHVNAGQAGSTAAVLERASDKPCDSLPGA